MSKLLIVGARGHAHSVLDCAVSTGEYDDFAFLEDYGLKEVLGYPVLGKIDEAEKFIENYKNIVVAVGDNAFRLDQVRRLKALGFHLPILKHSTSYVSPYVSIGEGSVLLAQSVVNANAVIGMGCIINTGASVDHDCFVGDGVHISVKSSICGTVKVGDKTFVGAGTTVIEKLTIGSNVLIGAGSLVIRDIKDNCKAYGCPAKTID